MMRLIVAMFLIAASCGAQDKPKSGDVAPLCSTEKYCFSETNPYIGGMPYITMEDAPVSIHDYMISQVKQWTAHEKDKYPGVQVLMPLNIAYTTKDGKRSSLIVDEDGELHFDNMTAEDALLMLISEEIYRTMESNKLSDYYEAEHKKAMADIPPPKVKVEGKYWPIWNVPQYDQDANILASANCNARWIKVRDDRTEKRTSVMHELMHVATGCDKDEKLHSVIYRMAPALLKLMQDNPDVVNYLMTKPEEVKK